MKKIKVLLFFLICASSLNAKHYISDDLYTFMRSGPAAKYKIIGSVNTGEHIEVLQRNSNFTQIRDSKGRVGWIFSKFVSSEMGLKEKLDILENEFENLQEELDNAREKMSKDEKTLKENLKLYNNQVKELKKLKELNKQLNQKLDTQRNEQLMRWFTYGGMVAGGGLLLGLILPLLMPSRKRRNRW